VSGGRRRFPPLQRAQLVELACLEPIAEGLHITHWTGQDLARQAVADGIVDAISPRTVQRILRGCDLCGAPATPVFRPWSVRSALELCGP